jgi:predicted unusual protein kinase regulating ubiquinone biosynthesis (AarF/ABC1/UbiB family)
VTVPASTSVLLRTNLNLCTKAADNTSVTRNIEGPGRDSHPVTRRVETLALSPKSYDPIKETFRDVTAWKLFRSSWRVFWQIHRTQGWAGAVRVIPIIWMIIVSVRGFARYHAAEFERMMSAANAKEATDQEAEALSASEYEEYRKLGRWLREKLHSLGPTFIKIGQTLSTRADLVPLPTMLELSSLQEAVEPSPNDVALQTIERDLGKPLSELYASFDPEPIAAASLSQAYRAVLKDGRDVVVKVQRPDLFAIITRDVETLGAVAEEVMNYPSLCRHTDWPSVNVAFAKTIFEEIDYIREGRNADTFRHNFRDNPKIYIPRIVWRLTGRRVLTIEYVSGGRITDLETLDAMGVDRDELTHVGVNFYLKQLLEDGFFHADPHPGNMRIMPDGRVGIFDFGMVGRVQPQIKQAMVNAFMHVVKRDYRALVDDFVDMGFLDPDADREGLCSELTPILSARFNEGISRVQFRKVLFDFSDVVYRYPFRLPSDFTYIMRALLTLEGVALTINPEFNFVEASMPFAQKLIWREAGANFREVIWKEVFGDGKFNAAAAINLVRTAYRLRQDFKQTAASFKPPVSSPGSSPSRLEEDGNGHELKLASPERTLHQRAPRE